MAQSQTAVVKDWSSTLELFVYLQVLDVLTTLVGFRTGLIEASPFIQLLMRMGPIAGLLASKFVSLSLGGYCIWRERMRVLRLINYWYSALIIWNLVLIAVH